MQIGNVITLQPLYDAGRKLFRITTFQEFVGFCSVIAEKLRKGKPGRKTMIFDCGTDVGVMGVSKNGKREPVHKIKRDRFLR